MSESDNAQNVIESYRRRQQRSPFLLWGLAVVLVIIGLLALALWLTGDNRPPLAFFASATPTATDTPTPTDVPPSPTATPVPPTPTETTSPTPTITASPSEPFIYVVQEGDTCFSIAEQFNIDIVTLLAVNDLDSDCAIFPSTELVVPPPGAQLDTPTPIPDDFFGRIEYRVQVGDTLDSIAIQFNSTVDAILDLNDDLENPNEIFAGQILTIPVNLVTPAPTATEGPTSVSTPGTIMTLTPAPSATP